MTYSDVKQPNELQESAPGFEFTKEANKHDAPVSRPSFISLSVRKVKVCESNQRCHVSSGCCWFIATTIDSCDFRYVSNCIYASTEV